MFSQSSKASAILFNLIPIHLNDPTSSRILLFDNPCNLLIDKFCGRVAQIFMGDYVPPQKHFGIIVTIKRAVRARRSCPNAEPSFEQDRWLVSKSLAAAGSHLPHKYFLGDSTAHQHGDSGKKVIPVVAISIFFGQLHRKRPRPAHEE